MNTIKQKLRFTSLSKEFHSVYKKTDDLGSQPFITPFWDSVNIKVLKSFKPFPKWDFLSNRAITDTMFVVGDSHWLNTQIKFLRSKIGKDLERLAKEEAPGKPTLLTDSPLKTSHNTIHHLYHIYYFLQETKVDASKLKTVVEWGGGYGNFARLWRKAIDSDGTYVIIDTALFSVVQWLYLSTIFGRNSVNLINDQDTEIKPGVINLVPLASLKKTNISGDLFVSTWGLSESESSAQDYVIKKKWFDCPHLLIGFQDNNNEIHYADRLGKYAKKSGATITDIDFIPNNHYALK